MPSLQRFHERCTREKGPAPTPTRAPTRDRTAPYRYLARQPRLPRLRMHRPPYFAAVVVAAVFVFLAYLVFAGT
jgi:hypothetical protein